MSLARHNIFLWVFLKSQNGSFSILCVVWATVVWGHVESLSEVVLRGSASSDFTSLETLKSSSATYIDVYSRNSPKTFLSCVYWETMHDSKWDFRDQSYSIVAGFFKSFLSLPEQRTIWSYEYFFCGCHQLFDWFDVMEIQPLTNYICSSRRKLVHWTVWKGSLESTHISQHVYQQRIHLCSMWA